MSDQRDKSRCSTPNQSSLSSSYADITFGRSTPSPIPTSNDRTGTSKTVVPRLNAESYLQNYNTKPTLPFNSTYRLSPVSPNVQAESQGLDKLTFTPLKGTKGSSSSLRSHERHQTQEESLNIPSEPLLMRSALLQPVLDRSQSAQPSFSYTFMSPTIITADETKPIEPTPSPNFTTQLQQTNPSSGQSSSSFQQPSYAGILFRSSVSPQPKSFQEQFTAAKDYSIYGRSTTPSYYFYDSYQDEPTKELEFKESGSEGEDGARHFVISPKWGPEKPKSTHLTSLSIRPNEVSLTRPVSSPPNLTGSSMQPSGVSPSSSGRVSERKEKPSSVFRTESAVTDTIHKMESKKSKVGFPNEKLTSPAQANISKNTMPFKCVVEKEHTAILPQNDGKKAETSDKEIASLPKKSRKNKKDARRKVTSSSPIESAHVKATEPGVERQDKAETAIKEKDASITCQLEQMQIGSKVYRTATLVEPMLPLPFTLTQEGTDKGNDIMPITRNDIHDEQIMQLEKSDLIPVNDKSMELVHIVEVKKRLDPANIDISSENLKDVGQVEIQVQIPIVKNAIVCSQSFHNSVIIPEKKGHVELEHIKGGIVKPKAFISTHNTDVDIELLDNSSQELLMTALLVLTTEQKMGQSVKYIETETKAEEESVAFKDKATESQSNNSGDVNYTRNEARQQTHAVSKLNISTWPTDDNEDNSNLIMSTTTTIENINEQDVIMVDIERKDLVEDEEDDDDDDDWVKIDFLDPRSFEANDNEDLAIISSQELQTPLVNNQNNNSSLPAPLTTFETNNDFAPTPNINHNASFIPTAPLKSTASNSANIIISQEVETEAGRPVSSEQGIGSARLLIEQTDEEEPQPNIEQDDLVTQKNNHIEQIEQKQVLKSESVDGLEKGAQVCGDIDKSLFAESLPVSFELKPPSCSVSLLQLFREIQSLIPNVFDNALSYSEAESNFIKYQQRHFSQQITDEAPQPQLPSKLNDIPTPIAATTQTFADVIASDFKSNSSGEKCSFTSTKSPCYSGSGSISVSGLRKTPETSIIAYKESSACIFPENPSHPTPDPSIYENSLYPFLPHILAYKHAECFAQMERAKEEKNENDRTKIDVKEKSPPPPPNGSKDDANSSTHSLSQNPSNGKGTQVLFSDLSGLMSNWFDLSTKLSFNEGNCSNSQQVQPVASSPTSSLMNHSQNMSKELAKEELNTLKSSVDALIDSLSSLNPSQIKDTWTETKRIQNLLKIEETKAETLKESLNTLPKDSEVQFLCNQIHQLLYRLRALQSYTNKLDRKLTDSTQPEKSDEEEIISRKDTIISLSADDSPDKDSCLNEPNIIEPSSIKSPTTMEIHSSSSQSVSFQTPSTSTCTMTSIEVSGAAAPTKEFTSEVYDSSGGKIYTKIKQSGFVSQTKQVSTTHSFSNEFASPNLPEGHLHDWLAAQSHPIVITPSPTFEGEEETRKLSEQEGQIVLAQALPATPGDDDFEGGVKVTVKQVRQVVTRRIIRKRRRIIRRVVVINGVEQVTEEVIEEPDEIDEQSSEMSTGPMIDIVHGSLSRPVSPGLTISEIPHFDDEPSSANLESQHHSNQSPNFDLSTDTSCTVVQIATQLSQKEPDTEAARILSSDNVLQPIEKMALSIEKGRKLSATQELTSTELRASNETSPKLSTDEISATGIQIDSAFNHTSALPSDGTTVLKESVDHVKTMPVLPKSTTDSESSTITDDSNKLFSSHEEKEIPKESLELSLSGNAEGLGQPEQLEVDISSASKPLEIVTGLSDQEPLKNVEVFKTTILPETNKTDEKPFPETVEPSGPEPVVEKIPDAKISKTSMPSFVEDAANQQVSSVIDSYAEITRPEQTLQDTQGFIEDGKVFPVISKKFETAPLGAASNYMIGEECKSTPLKLSELVRNKYDLKVTEIDSRKDPAEIEEEDKSSSASVVLKQKKVVEPETTFNDEAGTELSGKDRLVNSPDVYSEPFGTAIQPGNEFSVPAGRAEIEGGFSSVDFVDNIPISPVIDKFKINEKKPNPSEHESIKNTKEIKPTLGQVEQLKDDKNVGATQDPGYIKEIDTTKLSQNNITEVDTASILTIGKSKPKKRKGKVRFAKEDSPDSSEFTNKATDTELNITEATDRLLSQSAQESLVSTEIELKSNAQAYITSDIEKETTNEPSFEQSETLPCVVVKPDGSGQEQHLVTVDSKNQTGPVEDRLGIQNLGDVRPDVLTKLDEIGTEIISKQDNLLVSKSDETSASTISDPSATIFFKPVIEKTKRKKKKVKGGFYPEELLDKSESVETEDKVLQELLSEISDAGQEKLESKAPAQMERENFQEKSLEDILGKGTSTETELKQKSQGSTELLETGAAQLTKAPESLQFIIINPDTKIKQVTEQEMPLSDQEQNQTKNLNIEDKELIQNIAFKLDSESPVTPALIIITDTDTNPEKFIDTNIEEAAEVRQKIEQSQENVDQLKLNEILERLKKKEPARNKRKGKRTKKKSPGTSQPLELEPFHAEEKMNVLNNKLSNLEDKACVENVGKSSTHMIEVVEVVTDVLEYLTTVIEQFEMQIEKLDKAHSSSTEDQVNNKHKLQEKLKELGDVTTKLDNIVSTSSALNNEIVKDQISSAIRSASHQISELLQSLADTQIETTEEPQILEVEPKEPNIVQEGKEIDLLKEEFTSESLSKNEEIETQLKSLNEHDLLLNDQLPDVLFENKPFDKNTGELSEVKTPLQLSSTNIDNQLLECLEKLNRSKARTKKVKGKNSKKKSLRLVDPSKYFNIQEELANFNSKLKELEDETQIGNTGMGKVVEAPQPVVIIQNIAHTLETVTTVLEQIELELEEMKVEPSLLTEDKGQDLEGKLNELSEVTYRLCEVVIVSPTLQDESIKQQVLAAINSTSNEISEVRNILHELEPTVDVKLVQFPEGEIRTSIPVVMGEGEMVEQVKPKRKAKGSKISTETGTANKPIIGEPDTSKQQSGSMILPSPTSFNRSSDSKSTPHLPCDSSIKKEQPDSTTSTREDMFSATTLPLKEIDVTRVTTTPEKSMSESKVDLPSDKNSSLLTAGRSFTIPKDKEELSPKDVEAELTKPDSLGIKQSKEQPDLATKESILELQLDSSPEDEASEARIFVKGESLLSESGKTIPQASQSSDKVAMDGNRRQVVANDTDLYEPISNENVSRVEISEQATIEENFSHSGTITTERDKTQAPLQQDSPSFLDSGNATAISPPKESEPSEIYEEAALSVPKRKKKKSRLPLTKDIFTQPNVQIGPLEKSPKAGTVDNVSFTKDNVSSLGHKSLVAGHGLQSEFDAEQFASRGVGSKLGAGDPELSSSELITCSIIQESELPFLPEKTKSESHAPSLVEFETVEHELSAEIAPEKLKIENTDHDLQGSSPLVNEDRSTEMVESKAKEPVVPARKVKIKSLTSHENDPIDETDSLLLTSSVKDLTPVLDSSLTIILEKPNRKKRRGKGGRSKHLSPDRIERSTGEHLSDDEQEKLKAFEPVERGTTGQVKAESGLDLDKQSSYTELKIDQEQKLQDSVNSIRTDDIEIENENLISKALEPGSTILESTKIPEEKQILELKSEITFVSGEESDSDKNKVAIDENTAMSPEPSKIEENAGKNVQPSAPTEKTEDKVDQLKLNSILERLNRKKPKRKSRKAAERLFKTSEPFVPCDSNEQLNTLNNKLTDLEGKTCNETVGANSAYMIEVVEEVTEIFEYLTTVIEYIELQIEKMDKDTSTSTEDKVLQRRELQEKLKELGDVTTKLDNITSTSPALNNEVVRDKISSAIGSASRQISELLQSLADTEIERTEEHQPVKVDSKEPNIAREDEGIFKLEEELTSESLNKNLEIDKRLKQSLADIELKKTEESQIVLSETGTNIPLQVKDVNGISTAKLTKNLTTNDATSEAELLNSDRTVVEESKSMSEKIAVGSSLSDQDQIREKNVQEKLLELGDVSEELSDFCLNPLSTQAKNVEQIVLYSDDLTSISDTSSNLDDHKQKTLQASQLLTRTQNLSTELNTAKNHLLTLETDPDIAFEKSNLNILDDELKKLKSNFNDLVNENQESGNEVTNIRMTELKLLVHELDLLLAAKSERLSQPQQTPMNLSSIASESELFNSADNITAGTDKLKELEGKLKLNETLSKLNAVDARKKKRKGRKTKKISARLEYPVRSCDIDKEIINLENKLKTLKEISSVASNGEVDQADRTSVTIEYVTDILESITSVIEQIELEIENTEAGPSDSSQEKIHKQELLKEKLNKLNEISKHVDQIISICPSVQDVNIKHIVSNSVNLALTEISDAAETLNDIQQELLKIDQIFSQIKRLSDEFNKIRSQLGALESSSLNTPEQLSNLIILEDEYIKAKGTLYDLMQEIPINDNEVLGVGMRNLHDLVKEIDLFMESETERLNQSVLLSEEYKSTLAEFQQIITFAQQLLDEKPNVHSLDHFQAEINRRRKFFGNLKRCQQTLEKLEFSLEPSTSELNRNLQQKLYNEASRILYEAAKMRQQMAVTSSRWQRLEQGLEEEFNWLRAIIPKIPHIENIQSADVERNCSVYQTLYSDLIVHQARLWQLTTVTANLQGTAECTELQERCDHLVENLFGLTTRVTNGVQSLVGFRDSYNSYEKLIARLRSWLQRAETKMDVITMEQVQSEETDLYQFWELKAQLENQEPLHKEAAQLLEHALRTLNVIDEGTIRDNYDNFGDRWNTLAAIIGQNELTLNHESQVEDSSATSSLNAVEISIADIQQALGNLNVVIESEDDLYQFLEQMQLLKAQVLNKSHQLNCLMARQDIDPDEAERIAKLMRTTYELDSLVNNELDAGHTIREKIATFGRMSSKAKRVQDTLQARVDQWTSFFELSQDILKQALDNCQILDSEISECHGQVRKMDQVLCSFPSTTHVSFNPLTLEAQLHELEATLHTLTARIQDLKKRVEEQLGFWQEYEHALNTVAILVHQNNLALEVFRTEPPTTFETLELAQHYVQGLQDSVVENRICVEKLIRVAKKLQTESSLSDSENNKSTSSEAETEIEKRVESSVDEWTQLETQVESLASCYSTCEHLWSQITSHKSDIEQWINATSTQSDKSPEEIKCLIEQISEYELKMNQLQTLLNELSTTLYCNAPENSAVLSKTVIPLHPLKLELENLSRKLEDLKADLIDGQTKTNMEQNAKDQILSLLNNLSRVPGNGKENAELVNKERFEEVHQDLIKLGKIEGRMNNVNYKGATSSNLRRRVRVREDEEFVQLLRTSQNVFQETFVEYLKLLGLVGERENIRELYELWYHHLQQIQQFLSEPIPETTEQLIEDASLCSLYQAILTHKSPPPSLSSTSTEFPSGVPISYESLEKLQSSIEEELIDRQTQVQLRLNAWNSYQNSKESLCTWLSCMEREKRSLELPFLQLQRLPITQKKIKNLVERCNRGAKLLDDCKRNQSDLIKFTHSHSKQDQTLMLLAHDLSSSTSRLSNLEAALKTWLDRTNRLSNTNAQFITMAEEISLELANIRDKLTTQQPPTTFTKLNDYVLRLKDFQQQIKNISRIMGELQLIMDEMKLSASPHDSKELTQKYWSLTQEVVDLQTILNSKLSAAQETLEMVPRFDTKCRAWLVWADGIIEKIEKPKYHTLEEYKAWLDNANRSEINPKQKSYEWLITQGTKLATMTCGDERQELLKALEQLQLKWNHLNQLLNTRVVKVNHLIQGEEKLNNRVASMMKRLKTFDSSLEFIVNLPELNLEYLNKAIHNLEMEQQKLNNESSNVNQLFNLNELAANDCEDIGMYENSIAIRQNSKKLYDLWNQLISSYQQKNGALVKLREEWKRLMDSSDYLETLLTQVQFQLDSIENRDGEVQNMNSSELTEQLGEVQVLMDSLTALTPQVDDLRNSYCFYINQVNFVSDKTLHTKVKKTVSLYNTLLKRCDNFIKTKNKSISLTQFSSAYYQPAQDFLQSINDQVEALSVDGKQDYVESDPEITIQLLEHLKGECEEKGKQLEEAMKLAGQSVCQLDNSLKAPITHQLDSYNSLKKNLETLFTEIMTENQRKKTKKKKSAKGQDEVGDISGATVSSYSQQEGDSTLPIEPWQNAVDSNLLLTRQDIYNQELESAVEDTQQYLTVLGNLSSSTAEAVIDNSKYDNLVKTLAQAQASIDMVQHLDRLVNTDNEVQADNVLMGEDVEESSEYETRKFDKNRRKSVKEIGEMVDQVKQFEDIVRTCGERLREASPSKKAIICPVCSPKQRGIWDSTLWRLQQWLQHSEASLKQAMKRRPSMNLEHLENAILKHRELLLDLDSHRSLVLSLTNVLEHLNTHVEDETMDEAELRQLKERLQETLEWWRKICHNAALWQARLQIALIQNSDFHLTIQQYEDAIGSVQNSIQQLEPIHLTDPRRFIVRKLKKFKDLSAQLTRVEPDLVTLQQTAEQLFVNASCIEKEGTVRHQSNDETAPSTSSSIFTTPECRIVLNRIANLNQQLKSSLRVCNAYVKHINTFLEQNLEHVPEETFDQSEHSSPAPSPNTLTREISIDENEDDDLQARENDESSLVAGGRMAYRVLRTSLPLQAFLLLLLGVGALLPYGEQDYSCFSANTFARSFETMLHWNGPPPI